MNLNRSPNIDMIKLPGDILGIKVFNVALTKNEVEAFSTGFKVSIREIIHRDDFGRPVYGPDILEDHKLMENEDFDVSNETDSWCKTSTLPLFMGK